jgi:hypothetical protein
MIHLNSNNFDVTKRNAGNYVADFYIIAVLNLRLTVAMFSFWGPGPPLICDCAGDLT